MGLAGSRSGDGGVLTFPGARGWLGRRAGGWAGGGGGLWAVEGAPGLSPCRRRPRRRHHGHRVEEQVGHRRRQGWWESRFGGGGGWGREGRAAAWPRHFFNFFGCRSGDPLGADVPDPPSDDRRSLTWKVSVLARGRARRLRPPRPPALAPSCPSPDPCEGRVGDGRLPPVTLSPQPRGRLGFPAPPRVPARTRLPAPLPPAGAQVSPSICFSRLLLTPGLPCTPRRTLPTLAFSDPEPPAQNFSATPSPPGRLPRGSPAPVRLARRPAPRAQWGSRLPQPSGQSVRPSSPRSCIVAPLLPPTPLLPAPSRICPWSPALLRVLPTPLRPVRPSLFAAYAHVPPLPVPQPGASPAALLCRRFPLTLPGVEAELRPPPTPGGSGVPAHRWGCLVLSPFPPTGEARG